MYNPEKLTTLGIQQEIRGRQSRMYNLEKLTTLGIQQDIRGRQTQNVQYRDTENIGYITRHKRKTETECTI